MPKVKKNRKYTKSYTEAILQQALSEIKSGEPKKKVAVRYGIPRSTLQFRLGPNFSKTELGHHIYLSKDDENKLVEWILESHRKGFPRRKLDIQLSVKSFMEASKRPRENTPGDQWYKLFLNRHPVLTERTPEGVTAASANVSEENIKGWFTEVESYLKENRYFSILEDPSRVYNGDETCFQFCPKLGKVIAPKGAKNIYEVDRGEAKQNLTVRSPALGNPFQASGDTKVLVLRVADLLRLSASEMDSATDGLDMELRYTMSLFVLDEDYRNKYAKDLHRRLMPACSSTALNIKERNVADKNVKDRSEQFTRTTTEQGSTNLNLYEVNVELTMEDYIMGDLHGLHA
ncbi:homeobox-like domain superfamily [Holotrichia oblita]|uniref:Homeobox-like domain superfamily n=1 Tax=Holotrichia oblita TaxID=644536 RepID=A0ACB9SKC6_HOLOL|nr:homeobox-like domain superfamily [Holotrichia oblita]